MTILAKASGMSRLFFGLKPMTFSSTILAEFFLLFHDFILEPQIINTEWYFIPSRIQKHYPTNIEINKKKKKKQFWTIQYALKTLHIEFTLKVNTQAMGQRKSNLFSASRNAFCKKLGFVVCSFYKVRVMYKETVLYVLNSIKCKGNLDETF